VIRGRRSKIYDERQRFFALVPTAQSLLEEVFSISTFQTPGRQFLRQLALELFAF